MKKILVITFITGLSLAAMFYLTRLHCFIDRACPAASQQVGQPSGKPYAPPKEKVRGIYAAMEYLHQIRANSQTGELDLADVYRARQQMMEQRIRQQSMKSSAALQLEWEELGPDNVGGRTRAILVDRNNPSRVYAGGVSGGLFYSDNGGLSWNLHPDNVNFGHLGISCMAQASNGDIYFGTGEYFAYGDGHTNSMAFIGEGIYKSTDGGQTFQHLPSTTPSVSNSRSAEWAFVNELAIHPMDDNYVYAATNRGLRISNDAGATWNVIPNLDVGTNNNCSEVVVGGNGVIYASINNQYYRSEDFGLNFTRMMGQGGYPNFGGISRIEFAVSPQDPNYVYSLVCDNNDALEGVYQSKDAGLTWTAIAVGGGIFNPLGQQGSYDMVIAVDPSNKERIFVGGQLEFWSWSSTDGWNLLATWAPETPTNPRYIHADMHEITFHPTNPDIMYVGSDGGISKTTNATDLFPVFVTRNKGYITTQFYGMDASTCGEIMGGSQDNGNQLIDFTGNSMRAAREVKGGDGGQIEFSRKRHGAMFAEYINGSVERASSFTSGFFPFFDFNIDCQPTNSQGGCQGDGEPDDGALFIAPFVLWEDDDMSNQFSVFYLGTASNVWLTHEALNFSTIPRWYRLPMPSVVSAIEVSKEGIVYAGTIQGDVYRFDGLDTASSVWDDIENGTINDGANLVNASAAVTRTQIFNGSQWVTGIAVDPHNPEHVIITLGNYGNADYVYRSTNAASASNVSQAAFTSIQNNLPAMPVYDAEINYYNSNVIILGTELGVWASEDAGQTWTEQNTGMHPVPVYKVRQEYLYTQNCPVIYIGTFGRGMFRTTSLMDASCDKTPGKCATGIQALNELGIESFEVYPNPVTDRAIVRMNVDQAQKVNIVVSDLSGRMVKSIDAGRIQGEHEIQVDFGDVAAGTYLVSLNAAGSNLAEARKVVVLK